MYVLGISAFYHDAAACLLKDGVIVAAAQQERFSRKKHDPGFPKEAIEYCLKEAGITAKEIGAVAFYEKPYLKFERLLFQFVDTFPHSLHAFVDSIPDWLTERLLIPTYFEDMKITAPIYYLEHHLSHAAASYLASPFEKAAILTVDGVGEWATTTMGVGNGNAITLKKEIRFPHSLGLLYSAITAYLGFRVNDSEYKVMGLAPYGKPIYKKQLDELMSLNPDGSFTMNMDYFAFHYSKKMNSQKLEKLFGQPTRIKETEITQFHMDVAASLQVKTEEVLFHLLNQLHAETKMENVCLGGGVALNSVSNGKILSNTKFKRVFIQPAAGDAGSAMGAALYVHHTLAPTAPRRPLTSAFLGPQFSDDEIQAFLDAKGIVYTRFATDKELSKKVAKLLYENNVIGWHHGRMEWGPRALGARSILSNPCNPEMQDILNLKVKHREKFRPFAPVIPLEDVPDWFDCDKPVPEPADYMLMVYPIKKAKRKLIPAVTHVDGSGRLQVIRKTQHPLYYATIKEFEKLSKVPILINTSFNIRGEPIVCTPEHAYRCMMGTGIDYLSVGHFLVKRSDNLRDAWDSEKIAKD